MARGAQPLKVLPATGLAALAAVAALLLAPLAALMAQEVPGRLGPSDLAALRFTLVQATLSAGLSVLVALPVARALARRRFAGRRALILMLGAPFVLPAIVAVLGLTAVWGRAGPVSDALAALGAGRLDIYGLTGVVLGHVFFNLPLVTRMLLQGWAAIPAEHWRLAAHLGMPPGAVFRHVEAPMLREILPGAVLLVFLLCMSSFAVALTMGGGPGASTLEVAIYQALRFDFAPGRAALLALIQLAAAATLGLLLLRLGAAAEFGPGLAPPSLPALSASRWRRALDGTAIIAASAFLLAPVAALAARGLPALLGGLPAPVWQAAAISAGLALASAALTLALALALARLVLDLGEGPGGEGLGGRLAQTLGIAGLAASPFVLGTGLFLILTPWTDPFALALPVTLAVNALMSLPFSLRLILPALSRARADYGRLADSLGIAGRARFRLVTWPRIRRPAAFAAGLSAALSAGDLGVIALFAPPDIATLPLSVYRLMGSYRTDDAMGAALLLTLLSLALFRLADLLGGRDDRA